MNTPSRSNLLSLIATILPAAMLMLSAQTSHAASATWNLNPGSGDWNTAANWTPATVPNGPTDIATFNSSTITAVSVPGASSTELDSIIYNSGASAFTMTISGGSVFQLEGAGITNNSGITQTLIVDSDLTFGGAQMYFFNSATVGSSTSIIARGSICCVGGATIFVFGTASAGNGTFTINGGAGGSVLHFFDTATAANSTFNINGGGASNNNGGSIYFNNGSTAGSATIINNGSSVFDANSGGQTRFQGDSTSTAGNATVIANAGSNGGPGGSINFSSLGSGGTARIEVFGNGIVTDTTNGSLNVGQAPRVTIGSLEGSGLVNVGPNNLTVGSNNTARSFSGVIHGGGENGVFTKIGTGTLTFEGGASNDHIGDAVTLSIASNSLINLNFTGDPDTVRSLIVGGITQLPGLYGSAASGAPNPLPQFAGLGKVLAKMVAVSRKNHPGAGNFDINLPFGGTPGIECRSGGVNGNFQVVVTFLNSVTFDFAQISGTGTVSSATGNGTTVVTVNLTGVANEQTIYVYLFNVNDGTTTETIPIPMGILVGDTNGDGVVNSGDSTQTKNRAGQPTNATNFRSDITTDGVINSGDSFIVKSRAGTSLP